MPKQLEFAALVMKLCSLTDVSLASMPLPLENGLKPILNHMFNVIVGLLLYSYRNHHNKKI